MEGERPREPRPPSTGSQRAPLSSTLPLFLPVCAAHDNAADEPVSRVLFTARAAMRNWQMVTYGRDSAERYPLGPPQGSGSLVVTDRQLP
jgi:hypothetical protein